MVRSEARGKSAPDAAPIPYVAHSSISEVLADVSRQRLNRDLKVGAASVKEATDAICENIYFVPVEDPESLGTGRHASGTVD